MPIDSLASSPAICARIPTGELFKHLEEMDDNVEENISLNPYDVIGKFSKISVL